MNLCHNCGANIPHICVDCGGEAIKAVNKSTGEERFYCSPECLANDMVSNGF